MKKTIYVIGNRSGMRQVAKKRDSKKYRNVEFILLPVVLPVHVVIGIIDFPAKGGKSKIKDRAQTISNASAVSTWVSIPAADILFVNGEITNYANSSQANRAGMKQRMTEAIQDKLLTPNQKAANLDKVNSILILQVAGFHVKLQFIPQIHQFKVKNGINPGDVEIETEGGPKGKRHLHLWYSSLDGVTYILVDSTNKANTILSGYPSDKTIYFKTELSIEDVKQGMSNAIYCKIN